MAINVRPVDRDDLSRVTDLLAQLGYPATTGQVRERLDRWLADPYGMLLVAEVDGAVAGVAALHAITLLEHDGRLGRLVALVVDEAYRGHGVGRVLVDRVEQEARRFGCRDLEITSSRHRADAHRFYLGLGYEDVCGRSARFLKRLTE